MPNPVIIDANSLITRAIMASALDDLKAGGIFTGGVYGTLVSLASIIRMPEMMAAEIVAFFDHGVPPARMKLLPDYKSKRKERKQLLSDAEKEKAFEQMHLARQALELLGVICLAYKNREADDGVAAAVRIMVDQGRRPVVVSGDKDLWQTISMGARVWYINTNIWVDEDNFEELTGVPLENYILARALTGDTSDSIVGIQGCGAKTAAKLIAENAEAITASKPMKQMEQLVAALAAKPAKKRRKVEQKIIDGKDYLRRVIGAISLWESFGSVNGLKKALAQNAAVQKIPFLRFSKSLSFKSVLGNPERFVRPFRDAALRR